MTLNCLLPQVTPISLFTLAALNEYPECRVYHFLCSEAEHDLIHRINPLAIETASAEGMDCVLIDGEGSVHDNIPFAVIIDRNHHDPPASYAHYCRISVPILYQELSSMDLKQTETDPIAAVDAEDVGIIAAHLMAHPLPHQESTQFHLEQPVSLAYLQAIHSRLPTTNPNTLSSKLSSPLIHKNDAESLLPGHQLCTLEEFITKYTHSLYHQRFRNAA